LTNVRETNLITLATQFFLGMEGRNLFPQPVVRAQVAGGDGERVGLGAKDRRVVAVQELRPAILESKNDLVEIFLFLKLFPDSTFKSHYCYVFIYNFIISRILLIIIMDRSHLV